MHLGNEDIKQIVALAALEKHVREYEEWRIRELKQSVSFMLGNLLVNAFLSPKKFLTLPVELWRLGSAAKEQWKRMSPNRDDGANVLEPEDSEELDSRQKMVREMAASYEKSGMRGLMTTIDDAAEIANAQVKSELIFTACKAIRGSATVAEELLLAEQAFLTFKTEDNLQSFCWVAKRAGAHKKLREGIAALEAINRNSPTTDREKLIEQFKNSNAYIFEFLNTVPQKACEKIASVDNRICYILHNSAPYNSGGYAVRAQGLAKGLANEGWAIFALTRPGYPVDVIRGLRKSRISQQEVIDGITYARTLSPLRANPNLDPTRRPDALGNIAYLRAASDALEKQLRQLRPRVVVAASNYITGLPALLAARRLGLRFYYEVRGFWEITRLSREPEFGESDEFVILKQIEAYVAQHADGVFTLTKAMKDELVSRSVSPDKIELLPNACDPKRFVPRKYDSALASKLGIRKGVPVIGYVGTFVQYEGLDDLVRACAILKERGTEFRLVLVGNEDTGGTERGPITKEIVSIAAENNFSEWLVMPGRISNDEVERYYSLIDIVAFPRKPLPVCEMVSPIKPLEALAMEKAVVVSSVRALEELIHHNRTGMVFPKGNVESLADTLQALIESPQHRLQLGEQGRKWVCAERSWETIASRASDILRYVKSES